MFLFEEVKSTATAIVRSQPSMMYSRKLGVRNTVISYACTLPGLTPLYTSAPGDVAVASPLHSCDASCSHGPEEYSR